MQNTFASLAPQAVRKNFWLMLALLIFTMITSCIIDDDVDPKIVSMTISPSQISRSEAGANNEFFTVTIEVANFDDEITFAEVYIESPHKAAVPGEQTYDGDTIVLSKIAKTWLGDLDPGIYNLAAIVKSETVPLLRETKLATVTITE